MAGRRTKLIPALHAAIVAYIRAGAFEWVAAEAAGIHRATYYRWMDRGREATSGIYREFYDAVTEARAQARIAAEVQVRQDNPLAWLRYGPGRVSPGGRTATSSPGRTAALSRSHSILLEDHMTRSPEWRYTRPRLYPYQLEAVFCEERYAVVEASTKSGKTTACPIWLSEQALHGRTGAEFWWIAPVTQQEEIAFARLKRAIDSQLYIASETYMTVGLHNDTVIRFLSGDRPDSLYGEDVYAAVLDEASRMKEEGFHAVRSTLTFTGGRMRIVGNVNGRQNWMYRLARKVEAGEPGMHYARITAYDAVEAGLLDAAEVEDARRQLPKAVFRELYLAEAVDDQSNPFGLEAILAALAPLSIAEPVVWGWDLAKSRDWSGGSPSIGMAVSAGSSGSRRPGMRSSDASSW